MNRRLKRRSPERGAAVAQLKDDRAGARQNLSERTACPILQTALYAGPAVHVDNGRVLFSRIESRRLEYAVVKCLAVGGREGAEFGHGIVAQIRRSRSEERRVGKE